MPRFQSFQSRLLVLFLGLFIAVQAASFLAVNTALTNNARSQIADELLVGERVFDRLITARSERLAEAARILSGDYAFKTAFSDGDRPTILSAMINHAARIRADVMMLVSLDRRMIADTLHFRARNLRFPLPALIASAEQTGEATSLEFIDGRLYQIVVVPLFAPVPVAWICIGFTVDDALARELQQLTNLDVTFVKESSGEAPVLAASTLPEGVRRHLISALTSAVWAGNGIAVIKIEGKDYVSVMESRGAAQAAAFRVILQRSLATALQPFNRLQAILLALAAGGLGISLIGGVLIARTVTKPVRELAAGALSIEQGDYGRTVPVSRQDELGKLAAAFNHMIAAIKQREDRITHQAYHDALTGLPNREQFRIRLEESIADARRQDSSLAIILMDIDRFKDVNAALGHATGDEILKMSGPFLEKCAPPPAIIARMGGDEFAVMPQVGHGIETAVQVVHVITKELESPFSVNGNPIQVEASFGIASFPDHGQDAETLLRRADIALYLAKKAVSSYVVYTPDLDRDSLRHLTLLGELRRAMDQQELVMYYQPKVDIASGRITGAEALIRWVHPQRGMIPPDDFIPLLEKTGLIKPVTLWTFRSSIAECARLNRMGIRLNIAVNLSARLLQDQQLPDEVTALLEEHRVPPEQITLEVTESAIMAEPARTLDVIRRLDAVGVRLCIDDFGTGYSSLTYLQKLPVDELKIDKSFVMSMETELNDMTIVQTIIALSHSFGLKVTAEGVETARAWELLKSRGCDIAQGYLMSRPIPVDDLIRWLRESRWGLPSQG